jgi:hypothetical protein
LEFISSERRELSILDKADNFVNELIKSIAACMAAAIVLCAIHAGHLRADDDPKALQVIFPDRVNSIEFGEPLFLPIALINPSEADLLAPYLSRLRMDLRLIVTFAGESEGIAFNNSFGGGEFWPLRANSSATTVVLANIWLPHVIYNIKDGDEIELEMILRTKRMNLESNSVTSGTIKVSVHGNSLKVPRPKFLGMIGDLKPRSIYVGPNSVSLSPFISGVSPLAALTDIDAVDSWYNPNGNEIQMAKRLAVSDSALSRLIEVSILLAQARAKSNPNGWKECSEEMHKLLSSASALEYVFYVGELGRGIRWNPNSMSPSDTSAALKHARKVFPLCVDFLRESE